MFMRWLRSAIGVCGLALWPAAVGAQAPAPPQSGTEQQAKPDSDPRDLPVSLDRIREGLKKDTAASLLRMAEIPADFRLEILEQQKIDALLSTLDFKSGPAPAGGLYGYEQQRRLFNPTDRPLMQPYAAFNGGQLVTIAIENLLARYLVGPLAAKAADSRQAGVERASREEVEAAIAAYCASRPDRDAIQLCTSRLP